MKKTLLLISALLLASCEKKSAPHPQPPAQADTPASAQTAQQGEQSAQNVLY